MAWTALESTSALLTWRLWRCLMLLPVLYHILCDWTVAIEWGQPPERYATAGNARHVHHCGRLWLLLDNKSELAFALAKGVASGTGVEAGIVAGQIGQDQLAVQSVLDAAPGGRGPQFGGPTGADVESANG